MNYSVNPNELLSIFAIPSSVADEHIKLASEYQLKALLLFLKNHQSMSVYDDISKKFSQNFKKLLQIYLLVLYYRVTIPQKFTLPSPTLAVDGIQ